MADTVLENRVAYLEDLMAAVARAQEESQRQLALLTQEGRAFRKELREFKQEMQEFKQEMLEFKQEMRQEIKDLNKKWGELANKMGTLAEDLVAPSLPRLAREAAGLTPEAPLAFFGVRVKAQHAAEPGRTREFDVVAVCDGYLLINETKTTLNARDVDLFVDALQEARQFFPHYADKRVIGVLASFYVDEAVVRYGERQGLWMLGVADDVMEVLNSPGFSPTAF
jgi:hypothetical protein